jgi:hypothetical protein
VDLLALITLWWSLDASMVLFLTVHLASGRLSAPPDGELLIELVGGER